METKEELLKRNKVLVEKINQCYDQMSRYRRLLVKNKEKLALFDNPAYRRASDEEEDRMLARIHRLPISSTPSFQVEKRLIASNHKHVPRSLEFSSDGYTFVTTCKGGRFNLWDSRSLMDPFIVGTINASADNKRWPEDVAFFPKGDKLIAAYKSPDADQQIALITFNRENAEGNGHQFVSYINKRGLKVAGGVRRVIFSDDKRFLTAGQDRSIYIWKIGNPMVNTLCHSTYHTNEINGLCALKNRSIVLSGGLDKRVIGYDYSRQKVDSFTYMNDPCLAVVPNPVNLNLLLIQTRNAGKQLTLFDYRGKKPLFEFGWLQQKTQTQYESVSPTWSPNGWFIATGSADPDIHVFDIRVNRNDVAQTIRNAHNQEKRVFKAAWHPRRSVLVSISSDHLLGYHDVKFQPNR